MNLESFFEKFDHFADAPNALPAMREIFLQLAVRGKLTERFDGEVSTPQLDVADAFRLRRGKRGEPDAEDTPFPIPDNWGWVAVGDSMDLVNGRAFKSEEWSAEGTPIIRIQNLNNENATFNHCNLDLDQKIHVFDGDLLISWSGTPGSSFGAFIWTRGFAYLNQHIFRCQLVEGVFLKEFLRLAINARLDEMISHARGAVGLRHITKGKLEGIRLPLPPLSEQKRIVAKVDELMALCNRLEQQQRNRATQRADLARASVARFADAPTSANLQFLFHPSYSISSADLKTAILTLAVQGKLVPQDFNDEPVDELLARNLTVRRKFKCTDATEVRRIAVEDALGYDIPASWRWQTLDDLLIFGPTNGFSPKAVDYETPVRSLTLSATTSGRFKGQHCKFITTEVPTESSLWLRDGDLLVQRGNTIEYVGVAAIYRGDPNIFIYPDLMMKLRVSSAFDVDFIHMVMSHDASRDFLRTRATGTSGTMPKINQKTLKSLPLPIPPLTEQRRIVLKVRQMMDLVDKLETEISNARSMSECLLEGLVSELLHVQVEA